MVPFAIFALLLVAYVPLALFVRSMRHASPASRWATRLVIISVVMALVVIFKIIKSLISN